MNLPALFSKQHKVFTLAFIFKAEKVLLGFKKRGFGVGKWNGFGGKLSADETVVQAAIREIEEECGLRVRQEDLKQVAVNHFEFVGNPVVMEVHIFKCDRFEGEVVESEEMLPKWFASSEIPKDEMWIDDEIWYPLLTQGERFRGILEKCKIKPILPPIMSESLRTEMRRYRELAIKVETTLKFKNRPAPTRLSQVPINTTVTLSPNKDNPSVYISESAFTNIASNSTFVSASLPNHVAAQNLTAFDMLSDHYSIKKPTMQFPAFPSSDEESVSSDSFKSDTGVNPSVTYIKLDEDSPIDPPPFFQDPPRDEDYQSEAMSLISLDNEEKHERQEVEEGESNSENHVSGRSSTETYTIEKNYISSDSENNNDTTSGNGNSMRKYFFSPIQSEDSEIVFNSENASTVKTQKHGYFSSPSSPSEHLTEASTISSVTSQASTVESFLSPKSTSSRSSVRKRFYFSSPETDDTPSKISDISNSGSKSSDFVESDSRRSDMTDSRFEKFDISILESKKSEIPKSDSKKPDNTISESKSMLPTRIPSPRKIPLTPTKINLMPDISSPVISPVVKRTVLDIAETPRVVKSPMKKAKNEIEIVPEVNAKSSQSLKVNLATLQSTLQNMSPSVFKAPPDARSPLLKGVVFLDPLFRPKRELRIPPEVSDPEMQPKFARATAAAKGFLVRRLLKTEKIQMIIQTIRDTVELVLKLYEEVPELKVRGWKGVNPEDADLCRRLFQQLTGTCSSFHDVFFKLTTPQRMAIIASDREKRKAKEMKTFLSRSARPTRGPNSQHLRSAGSNNVSRRKISTATVKCLERRMSALHS
ncbi:unnamed protein product [Allacma fusca]|uniref:Nudix hydrolase domain-containing protein n=1 Tax=Allacma fusca TaxID=39272 RepID=A0A8J2JM45_9HEXA|nr:unnamed protein product [Allacma fusca]